MMHSPTPSTLALLLTAALVVVVVAIVLIAKRRRVSDGMRIAAAFVCDDDTFVCGHCRMTKSVDEGCTDCLPDVCNDCYQQIHNETTCTRCLELDARARTLGKP